MTTALREAARAPAHCAASLIYVFLGLSFGASVPLVMSYLRRNGELPMMFGFGALSGPFEGFGTERFITLGWLLVAACCCGGAGGWVHGSDS